MTDFDDWYRGKSTVYAALLMDYIRIDTSSPNEWKAWDFISSQLEMRGFSVEKQPIHAGVWSHPHHCTDFLSRIDENSFNILAHRRANKHKTVLLNCHIDVVPGSDNFRQSFNPENQGGTIHGRGACDTKNHLIVLFAALDYLSERGISLEKNILLHLPIEEEIGGNGTLSMALHHRERADYAIVFEPTNLEIFRGHRGCVTFDIFVTGNPVHMGQGTRGKSAIMVAMQCIEALQALEDDMLHAARRLPAFSRWERPLQLNVGTIRGGEWHGSVPEECNITGNLGFVNDSTLEDVMARISKAMDTVAEHHGVRIDTVYRALKNDAYLIDGQADIVAELKKSCAVHGPAQGETFAWNVSCDARTYFKINGLPTVVFGCGLLEDAHSNHEKITEADLSACAKIMAHFLSSP